MMKWRRTTVLVLVLTLAACGRSATGEMGASVPTSVPTADAGTTAMAALKAIEEQDSAGLSRLFSSSSGKQSQIVTSAALDSGQRMHTILGSVTDRKVETLQQRGETTVIPVFVTYTQGTARWEFSLARDGDRWGLLAIDEKILTQP